MAKTIDLDLFFRAQKETAGLDLQFFATACHCTRGFLSRVRYGGKKFSGPMAVIFFRHVKNYDETWTMTRYFEEWEEIHRRFLIRTAKLDLWSDGHPGNGLPPCIRCGDPLHEGTCPGCPLECELYAPWTRRGRKRK